MKKKLLLMKMLRSKRKRKKIKTTDLSRFRSHRLRKLVCNKLNIREISGLRFKETVDLCHKCFLIDKLAMVGAGSLTTILKAEVDKVHLKCLLVNWWRI